MLFTDEQPSIWGIFLVNLKYSCRLTRTNLWSLWSEKALRREGKKLLVVLGNSFAVSRTTVLI
jgi:hypothetical protein